MFTIFGYKITEKQVLIAILLLGAILRFLGLGSAEFFHDEGFKAFRSIGYFDYIQNDNQTTPVQWFKDLPSLPWWTSLSFHDHPPLFFLVQHLFFRIFGDSLFVARLPSALAGVASVYLVYLISILGFRESIGFPKSNYAGLLAAFLLSVNLNHVWLSRASLMEAFQVFLILLNIYWFFRFIDGLKGSPSINSGTKIVFSERSRRDTSWVWFGLTLGLAFLAKYTSIFLVPVYLTYLIFGSISGFRESYGFPKSLILMDRRFYAALALAAILFSPVLVYNFYLYKTIGHFDLQFSYLFQQATPEWSALLGKIQDPFSEIVSNLTLMYSIPFLLLTIAGIGYAIYEIYKSKIKTPDVLNIEISTLEHREYIFLFWLLNIIFITLMLTKVGSAFRFIVLYAVPAIMLITYFFDYLFSRFHKEVLFKILLAVFLAYELFFVTDIFRTFPNFGITQLDQYLDSELGDKRSLAIPASPNPHLHKIIRNYALKIPPASHPIMIIYDENVSLSPRLWLFTRRNYYHGIPAVTVDQFKKFLREQGTEGFRDYQLYFVKASDKTYLNPLYFSPAAQEFETFLINERNLNPVKIIYNYNNLLMFTVYKFSIS